MFATQDSEVYGGSLTNVIREIITAKDVSCCVILLVPGKLRRKTLQTARRLVGGRGAASLGGGVRRPGTAAPECGPEEGVQVTFMVIR